MTSHEKSEKLVDSEQTARHIREVEAESVALICCEPLGLDGANFCRGYFQHWLNTERESVTKVQSASRRHSHSEGGQPPGCPLLFNST